MFPLIKAKFLHLWIIEPKHWIAKLVNSLWIQLKDGGHSLFYDQTKHLLHCEGALLMNTFFFVSGLIIFILSEQKTP